MSSETSNGYLNDAEVGLLAWRAGEEEPDSPSTHDTSMSMSVTVDTVSQKSLLLSHTEALAGTRTQRRSSPLNLDPAQHPCVPSLSTHTTESCLVLDVLVLPHYFGLSIYNEGDSRTPYDERNSPG